MEARHFLSDVCGLEESLWASKLLVANGDDLTVRKFISGVVGCWIRVIF